MTNIPLFHDKWSLLERSDFLINIGNCLEKGFPLKEALYLQQAEARNSTRKRILALINQLQTGQALSHAFKDQGFSHEVTSFLHFATHTGTLAQGFIQAGHFLQQKVLRRKKIEHLLRYPLFLFWLLAIMGYIILKNLLPNFEQLYQSMSISLPFISRGLLHISHRLPAYFGYGTSLIGGIVLVFFILSRTVTYETRLRWAVHLPFFAHLFKLWMTSIFSTHFGSLLKIGMTVYDALEIMENQSFHPFLKSEASLLKQQLTNGASLPKILAERPFYTKDLPTVVRNGSESGRLGVILVDYSQLLFKKLEDKWMRLILLIQPVFFLLFGGLLLIMFLSILLPMFDMMKGL